MYKTMATWYQALFPADEAVPAALARALGRQHLSGVRAADLGCADGGVAALLAGQGARVLACEPDPGLRRLAEARSAALQKPGDLRVFAYRMQDLGLLARQAPLDAVLCLGNTLPHLAGPAELAAFLAAAKGLLAARGALLLQFLNYDRILAQGVRRLPDVERTGLRLERHYKPAPDKRLRFTTRLFDNGGAVLHEGSVLLYPFTKAEVQAALDQAGFADAVWQADFAGSPADGSEFSRVLAARI